MYDLTYSKYNKMLKPCYFLQNLYYRKIHLKTVFSLQKKDVLALFPFWTLLPFQIIGTLFVIITVLVAINRMLKRRRNKKIMDSILDYFIQPRPYVQTVDEILWDMVRNCISRLDLEDCIIYLKDEKRNILVQKAAIGPKSTWKNEILEPIEIPMGKGIVGWVAQHGRSEMVGDTFNDPRYIIDDEARRSELTVPIIYEGKVIGIIDSEHSRKKFFTKDHLKIFEQIASICSSKISRAMAEADLVAKDIDLKKLRDEIAETRLTALRSKMNPHFIFNALNSIQECIISGDTDAAQKYLLKFANLLRMVLEFSEDNMIILDREIDLLTSYIELEALRFGHAFSYQIEVDKNLDTDMILIPGLIEQPYVENAIWHGLMKKEGEKKLFIKIREYNEDDLLIEIQDNGIGRIKAAELQSLRKNLFKEKSMGMKLSKDRLYLLEKQYNKKTEVIIEDVMDTLGLPAGTMVKIIIPLIYKYTKV